MQAWLSKKKKRLTVCAMTKAEAIALLGGRPRDVARVLNLTPQAVYQWPDELDQERTDRVIGAAVRLGKWPPPSARKSRASHAATTTDVQIGGEKNAKS